MPSPRFAKGNLLERIGLSGLSQTAGSSDSVLGLAALFDGEPFWPWRAGAPAAAQTFKLNGDFLYGAGGFESLTGWTDLDSGSGASTQDSGVKNSGTYSLKLDPGAGGVARRTWSTDLVMRAGEQATVKAALRGSGSAAGPAKVSVYIPELNLYYDGTNDVWTATPSAAISRTTGSFSSVSETFTVPQFATTLQDTVSLRVSAYNDGTAASYVDDLVLYSSVDLCTAHGHTLLPRHAVTVDSSDDGSSWTNRLTLTIAQPSFYGRISSLIAAQYWRFSYADPLSEGTAMIGELGLWQSRTVAAEVRHPALNAIEEPQQWMQERSTTPSGAQWVTSRGRRELRARPFVWRAWSRTALLELLDETVNRSKGGLDPMVLIPLDSENSVLYGRFGNASAPRRIQNGIWETTTEFFEEPGPDEGL